MPHHREQRNGSEGRQGDGDINGPECPGMSGTIDKGGFLQLGGHSSEEIQQQNDIIHVDELRQNERPKIVEQTEIFHQDVTWY